MSIDGPRHDEPGAVLAELGEMLRVLLEEYGLDDAEITMDTTFHDDLELESIDLVALSGPLREHYGDRVNFADVHRRAGPRRDHRADRRRAGRLRRRRRCGRRAREPGSVRGELSTTHVQRLTPDSAADGDAPVVVCVHGLLTDSLASYYFTLGPAFAAAGIDVIMYDLRGHGRSDAPGDRLPRSSPSSTTWPRCSTRSDVHAAGARGRQLLRRHGRVRAGRRASRAWSPASSLIEAEPPTADVDRAHGRRARRRERTGWRSTRSHRLDRRAARRAHRPAVQGRRQDPADHHDGRGHPAQPDDRRRTSSRSLPGARHLRRRFGPGRAGAATSRRTCADCRRSCCPTRATRCWSSGPPR